MDKRRMYDAGQPLEIVGGTPYRPEWEYKSAGPINETELDGLGKEGWELVSVLDLHDHFKYIFKRRVVKLLSTVLAEDLPDDPGYSGDPDDPGTPQT